MHALIISFSVKWLKTLSPEYCVVTNEKSINNSPILWKIERCADSIILATVDENGVIAEIGSGEIFRSTIQFTDNGHKTSTDCRNAAVRF